MPKFSLSTPSRRDVLVSVACLLAGVLFMGGAYWYKGNKGVTANVNLNLTEKKVANAVQTTTPAKPVPYTLKRQTSPFASLSPSKPVAQLPPMPVMPAVPVNLSASSGSKQEPVDSGSGRKGLHVTSVFLGSSGKNIAVLSNGKTQVTAREGKECKFGYVSSITREGVYLNGELVAVGREALAPVEVEVAVTKTPPPPPEVIPFVPPARDPLNPQQGPPSPTVDASTQSMVRMKK